MTRIPLKWAFLFCLFCALFIPVLFPSLRFYFFAPFLVLSFYQCKFRKVVWLSIFCGIIMDILTPSFRFGLFATINCIASTLLYKKKQQFFEDHFTTLPVMTFFYSVICSSFLLGVQLLDKNVVLSWQTLFADIIWMPINDAFFSLIFFILPLILWGSPQKRGHDYFLSRNR